MTKVGHLFFLVFSAITDIIITMVSERTFCGKDCYKEKATHKRQVKELNEHEPIRIPNINSVHGEMGTRLFREEEGERNKIN